MRNTWHIYWVWAMVLGLAGAAVITAALATVLQMTPFHSLPATVRYPLDVLLGVAVGLATQPAYIRLMGHHIVWFKP